MLDFKMRPIGLHIVLWDNQVPQTLGYFEYLPVATVGEIDKKSMLGLVRTETPEGSPSLITTAYLTIFGREIFRKQNSEN